ncbi:phosphate metabolism protein 7 [Coemansia helicoidea]|uniref:Phosphate metabolism protein 7 n=1 Tax=Coemansia helicoidea TaxID=1286919 RepID=A0ACC1LG52_9FUNG|nr:phosphate metabolism protein 7 [Coemansia helicoidea]
MVNANEADIQNPSLSVFLSALIFYSAAGAIAIGLFLVIRRRHPITYAPRSLESGDRGVCVRHAAAQRGNRRNQSWIVATVTALFFPDTPVYHSSGPDAAMFLRSLQSGALQFALFAVIGLPILLPVDATYENTSATELERLTMSSVANSYGRMWAHVGVFAACSCKS